MGRQLQANAARASVAARKKVSQHVQIKLNSGVRHINSNQIKTELPKPQFESGVSIDEAISSRRTLREFSEDPIALEQVASLLWAAQGKSSSSEFRNTPSAGSQYKFQVHVAIFNAEGLPSGTYQYDAHRHSLVCGSRRNVSVDLESSAIGDQPWVSSAAIVILLAADIGSLNRHFEQQKPIGKRGERYAYIEAGAILQNMALKGSSIGVGGVIVGGFDDEKVAKLFELNIDYLPIALFCAGRSHGRA